MMNKPKKKELIEPLYEYEPTFLKECQGYNQACDEWETYVKDLLKPIVDVYEKYKDLIQDWDAMCTVHLLNEENSHKQMWQSIKQVANLYENGEKEQIEGKK